MENTTQGLHFTVDQSFTLNQFEEVDISVESHTKAPSLPKNENQITNKKLRMHAHKVGH